MLNQNLLLTGDDGYNLSKSLRFRASASAYLSRTPASAGNRKTWTWSAWVKRGTQTEQMMFGCGVSGSDDSTYTYISFGGTNADQLYVNGYTQTWRKTTQLFRDFSAWYHIVVAVDTTQATADNRIKMYVNGSQITSFATSNNPSQNTDLSVNRNAAHSISSRNPYGADSYVDGYMADINFIDGQSLTPSSFGETDPITGVWKAKKFVGTYGTNGFYLPFTDVATTSGSNAGLGKDFSGNGNYWTTNNISVTSGSTYDSMSDVPTLTSATQANYSTLNPLDWGQGSDATFSYGNLRHLVTGTTGRQAWSTMAIPESGKWYFEVTYDVLNPSQGQPVVGVGTSDKSINTVFGLGVETSGGYLYRYTSGATSSYTTISAGDIIMFAIDRTGQKAWIGKNGTWLGSGNPSSGTNPAEGSLVTSGQYLVYVQNRNNSQTTFNFGQQGFTYTPPTGFVALNTFNLPEPSIKAGNKHFDISLYSATGSTPQTITNSGGFQPDLVWTKPRSSIGENALNDSVRGVSKLLITSSTGAEATDAQYLTSFNSNGYSLGTNNWSGTTVVGWQWKAGNSAGSSNTAGSITSTVSANPTAGFSVVTYTGNGSAGATVGHGLGVSPAMIIIKKRGASGGWQVYHGSIPSMVGGYIRLNSTAAFDGAIDTVWNYSYPDSSTFTLGTYTDVNSNGSTFVAYCFAEVAGYSKFGSYTGNGSTDGTFIHLGFRPKFFLWKVSSTTGSWGIIDASRDTYNVSGKEIFPNNSNAEASYTIADILSNGIKMKNTFSDTNGSGSTYIYMAFAENPFKYSLAR